MPEIPLISIITVTFNAEKFLKKTLESVAQQDYPHIEYVIVDGLSSDSTLQIINDFKGINFNIISEKDKGIYDAMNKGIALANGEYLMFLNAGDLLENSNTLSSLIHNGNSADVIYADTKIINTHFELVGMRHFIPPAHLNWKSFKRGMVVCHQSILCRKEICPNYDLNFKIAADIEWAIRLLKNAKTAVNAQIISTQFMQDGFSTQYRYKGWLERFKAQSKHYGLIQTLLFNFQLAIGYIFSPRIFKNIRQA